MCVRYAHIRTAKLYHFVNNGKMLSYCTQLFIVGENNMRRYSSFSLYFFVVILAVSFFSRRTSFSNQHPNFLSARCFSILTLSSDLSTFKILNSASK